MAHLLKVIVRFLVICACLASSQATGQEPAEDLFMLPLESLLDVEVSSASRREQSINDTPTSVGWFDADDLSRLSVQHPVEALSRLAGVEVMQVNANRFSVGMRGISQLSNNRVTLLLDGRRVTDLSSNAPYWGALTTHVGEIERMEVLRGPGSTFYGANSASGVVSIRSKRALEHPGIDAQIATGLFHGSSQPDDGIVSARLHGGGHGYAAYNWVNEERTFAARTSLNFATLPEWSEFDPETSKKHGIFNYGARLAVDIVPATSSRLNLDFTHHLSEEMGTASEGAFPARVTNEQAVLMSFVDHRFGADWVSMTLNADWRHLGTYASRNEVLDPTDQTLHVLIQTDLTVFDGWDVLTIGLEITDSRTENLFGVDANLVHLAGLVQNEAKLLDDDSLVLNLGARYEHISVQSSQEVSLAYTHLSPRGALVWRLGDRSDVRAALSTAYRTPSVFDSLVGVSRTIWPEPVPPVRLLAANPGLSPEHYTSAEIGYRGPLLDVLRLETVLWGQQVENVQYLDSSRSPWLYRNGGDLVHGGLELTVDLVASEHWRAFANYTATVQQDEGSASRVNDWPSHIYGVGLDALVAQGTNLHVDFFGTSGSQSPHELAPKALLNLELSKHLLDAHVEAFISGRNLLAGLRSLDSQIQAPGASPIGTSVLIGLSLR